MDLNTNFRGKLWNANLPKTYGLISVYEAVVNSIHSIEKNSSLKNNMETIALEIMRSSQQSLEHIQKQRQSIIGFKIIDDANFKSFTTLDSGRKIDKGCRGIGRLLWFLYCYNYR